MACALVTPRDQEGELAERTRDSAADPRRTEPTRTPSRAPGADRFELSSLRRIDWLRELGSTAIQLLQRSGFPKRYAVGELIFAPAANPESVYLLETGLARVYRVSEAGCETSFGYVAPGEVFGELAAFGDDPRESFAQAVQASLVWRIAREPFQRLMASRPSLVLAIAQQMAARLKRVEARVEDLVFRSVRIRVARMLSELAQSFGRPRRRSRRDRHPDHAGRTRDTGGRHASDRQPGAR